jgi:hypothetical protein
MRKKILGSNSSPLSTFFRSSSDTAKRAAYGAAAELRHRKSAQGTRKSETHSRSQGNSLKFSSRQRTPLSTYGFEGLAFPATPTQYMPK